MVRVDGAATVRAMSSPSRSPEFGTGQIRGQQPGEMSKSALTGVNRLRQHGEFVFYGGEMKSTYCSMLLESILENSLDDTTCQRRRRNLVVNQVGKAKSSRCAPTLTPGLLEYLPVDSNSVFWASSQLVATTTILGAKPLTTQKMMIT